MDSMVCATVNKNKQILEANNELTDTLLAEISVSEQEKDFYFDKQEDF